MNNNRNTFRKTKKVPTFWKPLALVGSIFADNEGKVAGFGCVGLLSCIAVIVYINSLVIDYLIWFVTSEHLPTWMNLVLALFLAVFTALIWVLGFIALALQHLNLFPIPVFH